jgi:3-deoxy-D-manno-octulosonic-acid transferase
VILYRILMLLALPVLLVRAALAGGLRERLAFGPLPKGRVWVHGASVGELASVRGLVARLAGPVMLTCNTVAARDLAAGWGLPGVTVRLAPLDTLGASGRVLRRTGARALVTVESELWPARLAACHRAGVPVAVVGARLSARSARGWGRWPALARAVLGPVAFLSPQDAASGQRFAALGVPAARVGPVVNLKAFVAATAAGAGPLPRAEVLLAASTHEGEEALVLDARPGWARLVILAPRHVERGDEVAALLAARGLDFGRRTRGDAPGGAPVYLADTLGEMAGWYAMAGVTVIGGTFSPRGGHTPFEPAAAGSAIVHGPDVANFAEPFARLAEAGGAVAVADAAGLAAALAGLTPDRQAALAMAARGALTPAGDLDELAVRIDALSA